MTQAAINYAKVLYELGIDTQAVDETRQCFEKVSELKQSLTSPVISIQVKHRIIDRVFPKEMKNFMKVLCDYQNVEIIEEIWRAYKEYDQEQKGILPAVLTYVESPDEQQLEQMKVFLCKKYHAKEVEWTLIQDPALLGGFILRVKDYEYDWSLKGRMNQLRNKLIWR